MQGGGGGGEPTGVGKERAGGKEGERDGQGVGGGEEGEEGGTDRRRRSSNRSNKSISISNIQTSVVHTDTHTGAIASHLCVHSKVIA